MHLILFSDMEDVQQIQLAPRCWWGLCWQEKPEGQNCKRNCHSRFVIYRWQRLKIKLRFFLSIIPLIWLWGGDWLVTVIPSWWIIKHKQKCKYKTQTQIQKLNKTRNTSASHGEAGWSRAPLAAKAARLPRYRQGYHWVYPRVPTWYYQGCHTEHFVQVPCAPNSAVSGTSTACPCLP